MRRNASSIDYQATALSEYTLHFSPDHKSIEAVKNPRRIETHFRSPQLHLWQRGETEWLLVMPQPERHRRMIKRSPENVVHLRFPEKDDQKVDQALSYAKSAGYPSHVLATLQDLQAKTSRRKS